MVSHFNKVRLEVNGIKPDNSNQNHPIARDRFRRYRFCVESDDKLDGLWVILPEGTFGDYFIASLKTKYLSHYYVRSGF